jgi:LysR family transcriptional regulator, low CO2-responsive transcriptional regulator
MELDQIETFLAVASSGGFHKAAVALRVSQPAVSARIHMLEESLGARLFVRFHGGVTLSPAGKALRPHAEGLLRKVTEARQAVHQEKSEAAGVLSIGAGLSISTYLLPDVLKKYQAIQPRVMVSVRSGNSMQVLKMVIDGEVDLGLARSLVHPEVDTISLRDDPLLLIGHPTHPAARKKRLKLQDVEELPLIFYDRGSSDWTLTNGLFRRAGLLPNIVLEVETIEACKRMILRELGLGFLPKLSVREELEKGKLRAIEITDAEILHRSLDVIRSRRRGLSASGLEFLELLRAATQEGKGEKLKGPVRRRSVHKNSEN